MIQSPEIKKFEIRGASLDPGYILKKQAFEEKKLKRKMLRDGYVPVLDIPPILQYEYNQRKESFLYVITIYGVKSEEGGREGWLTGRWIESTQKARSGK